jgi:hypothetical protein
MNSLGGKKTAPLPTAAPELPKSKSKSTFDLKPTPLPKGVQSEAPNPSPQQAPPQQAPSPEPGVNSSGR